MAVVHFNARRATGTLVALATLLPWLAPASAHAQWTTVTTSSRASFRGLSVASDGTIWLGGTHGTVLRSINGGITWDVDSVPGAASFDFRGVAAIDSRSAYVMVASADTGRIYKTLDAGYSWQLQFRDERKGVFLDGLECWDPSRCVAVGDPIGGRFLVVSTSDSGAHWTELPAGDSPQAAAGEAIFAASASSVVVASGGRAWIATGGGTVARVWRSSDYGVSWQAAATPVTAGTASAGLFSFALCPDGRAVAVGGDYRAPAATGSHVAMSTDGGATWTAGDPNRTTPYLSGVACAVDMRGHTVIIAVGPAGSFMSTDGQQWTRLGDAGFNAVAIVRGVAIAVGGGGAIASQPVFPVIGN